MFKTIKSKILVLSFIMLTVLMTVFVCYAGLFRMKNKQLMLQNYASSINSFVQQLDEKIIRVEDNSRDLALIGSLFYKTDRSIDLTNEAITEIFKNYENSLGGGIWFEPYVVDPHQKRACFYAYRNKDNEIVIDENFSSDEYDYHNQGWYKQIMSQLSKEHNTAWSLPYYENQGSETMMITAGTGIYDGDKLIGLSTVDWEISSISKDLSEMKPIQNEFSFYKPKKQIKDSFALFASKDYNYIIVSTDPNLDNDSLVGKTLDNIPWYNENLKEITYFKYHNRLYVPFVKTISNGMTLIVCIPKNEMFRDVDRFMMNLLLVLIIFGILIPIGVYAVLNRYVINPISKLTDIAQKIGKGEEAKIKIEKPEEFAQLASTFDKMTSDIKVITKERGKIDSELSIAKSIQFSSLPNVNSPFPNRKEFDIFASMEPAREVGGDFFDFYFIDDKDNFMFLVADVSGKGIPASLFMMTAKTLINNMLQVGYKPQDLIKIINKKLCENNKQGFFVTMISGIVNVQTGELTMVNCGHNQPLIKRGNGDYEYLDIDTNFPLGLFEDAEFSLYHSQLQKGDVIFAYTDGITEAMNFDEEMYGEKRLQDCLNEIKEVDNIEEILSKVKQNLKAYIDSAPQSDDITMLGFKYNGLEEVTIDEKVYEDLADIKNYKSFYSWLHGVLTEWGADKDLTNTIDMCSEELFANITFYAYPENKGNIKVLAKKIGKEISLKFEDSGIEYNPLKKPDPDITLPPEERPLGGLGIFMVKNMAKKVLYDRIDNKNLLTLFFDL